MGSGNLDTVLSTTEGICIDESSTKSPRCFPVRTLFSSSLESLWPLLVRKKVSTSAVSEQGGREVQSNSSHSFSPLFVAN